MRRGRRRRRRRIPEPEAVVRKAASYIRDPASGSRRREEWERDLAELRADGNGEWARWHYAFSLVRGMLFSPREPGLRRAVAKIVPYLLGAAALTVLAVGHFSPASQIILLVLIPFLIFSALIAAVVLPMVLVYLVLSLVGWLDRRTGRRRSRRRRRSEPKCGT